LVIGAAGLLYLPVINAQEHQPGNNKDQIVAENITSVEPDAYVSPNPCRGEIKVFYNNQAQTEVGVKITDITGKVVSQRNYTQLEKGLQTFDYDLTELPAGEYFVMVYDNVGAKTMKLLKQ